MNARVRPATAVDPPAQAACANGGTCERDICPAAAWSQVPDTSFQSGPSTLSVAARRIICREQELHDVVPVICEGWAASVVMLSDGSRQILSFLLPGDIVSAALFFDVRPHCLVEAITDVRYRNIKRAEFRTALRRTADERIARLILNLAERLSERGMVQSATMEIDFPLRQHHIADATGLTPVHVSKVLTEFRRSGLINISDRALTIVDPVAFRRVAQMR
jgi:CRP/FNR family transcriptional regulator